MAGPTVLAVLAVAAVLAVVSPADAATLKRFAYVANVGANTVSVIDTATNAVVTTISHSSFSSPFAVAVTPNGASVYVTRLSPSRVLVIDTATNSVTFTISDPSLAFPIAVAITPNGTRAYVTNGGTNNVSVINPADPVTATVGVGTAPAGVAIASIAVPPGPGPGPGPGPRPGPTGLPITGSPGETNAAIALTMIGLGAALLTISHRLAGRSRGRRRNAGELQAARRR